MKLIDVVVYYINWKPNDVKIQILKAIIGKRSRDPESLKREENWNELEKIIAEVMSKDEISKVKERTERSGIRQIKAEPN